MSTISLFAWSAPCILVKISNATESFPFKANHLGLLGTKNNKIKNKQLGINSDQNMYFHPNAMFSASDKLFPIK